MKTILFLLFAISTFAVQAATFNVSNPTEFQTALTSAEGNGENDIIILSSGTYNISTTLTFYSAENYSLTIQGSGAAGCILDGGGTTRIMTFETTTAAGDINISGITVQNGYGTYGAAGVNSESATITISNCIFTGNTATDFGGGLGMYTNTGTVIVDNCTFTNNTATGNDAGGLFVGTNSGSITLSNSTITNNEAQGDDAGGCMLYSDGGGTVIMHDNTFTNNIAFEDAGGAMVYLLGAGSSATIYANTFTGNTAGLGGGGCWIRLPGGGGISYYNNTHTHNTTDDGAGAGVLIELQINGNLNVSDNSFSLDSAGLDNGVVSDGGAIWIEHGAGTIDVLRNDIFNCYAYNNGGGIFTYTETGTLNIHHNRIANNSCENVGGGFSFAGAACTLNSYNNSYYGNTAGASGGSEYYYLDNAGATTNVYNNIYYNNSPDNFDYSGAVTISITYSLIQNSSAEAYYSTGCIDADPLFADAPNNNLLLTWANYPVNDATKSPCIDTGDPASPNDPDASRADMGAYYYGASLGIENNQFPEIKLYPNPATDYVHFILPGNEDYDIVVYDALGSIVYPSTPLRMTIEGSVCSIYISHLQPGIYFIELRGKKISRGRFVKE
ncbi:MAG: hypothetical protein C0592_12165 [Marinilabiliales bacterium]|nr:MAG: hypothetical protein C0592_12165 [Marinilabiliales bacterium]